MTQMNTAYRDHDDQEVDLGALLVRVWEKRWWVGISIVIVSTAFVSYAFLANPIYRASTLLVPVSAERSSLNGAMSSALGQLGGLAALAGISMGTADSETQESIAVLQSRKFTEAFIADYNLLPKFFEDDWDEQAQGWRLEVVNPPTLAKGYRYFDKDVSTVSQDRRTGLVTVQIDWRDRQEAADWANSLVQRLNAEMRARAVAKAEASVGFLQQELAATADIGTREAINRLIEAQIKQRMLVNVTEEYAFRVVGEALPPDSDDYVWPKKLIMIFLGPFVGAFLGVLLVLFRPLFLAPGELRSMARAT